MEVRRNGPLRPFPSGASLPRLSSAGAPHPGASVVSRGCSMRQRGAVRIVPRSPITVAIQDGGFPYAYGVVANISEAGACIWTERRPRSPGRALSLRLSFPRRSQPLDAEGVVVWGEPRDRLPDASALRRALERTRRSPRLGAPEAGSSPLPPELDPADEVRAGAAVDGLRQALGVGDEGPPAARLQEADHRLDLRPHAARAGSAPRRAAARSPRASPRRAPAGRASRNRT